MLRLHKLIRIQRIGTDETLEGIANALQFFIEYALEKVASDTITPNVVRNALNFRQNFGFCRDPYYRVISSAWILAVLR
ncbi:MAG: hypothetical protein EAZ61_07120, partial [Oscillatoriales cyanobacterium]